MRSLRTMILVSFLAILVLVIAAVAVVVYVRDVRLSTRAIRDNLQSQARVLAGYVDLDEEGLQAEIPWDVLPEYNTPGSRGAFRIRYVSGAVLIASRSLPAWEFPAEAAPGLDVVRHRVAEDGPKGHPWAIAVLTFEPRDERPDPSGPVPRLTVEVARDIEESREQSANLRTFLVAAGLGGVLLGILAATLVSRRLVAPIRRMSRTAAALEPEDPDRPSLAGGTIRELEGLARVLDDAFERLARTIEHEKRFTADVSHELRTPVTTLLANAEIALRNSDPEAPASRALRRQVEVARRLAHLIDDLLVLVRSDRRLDPIREVEVRLAEVVDTAVADLGPKPADRGVVVDVDCDPNVEVRGNREALVRVVLNLLSNALSHSPRRTEITVSVRREDRRALLVVSDHGPGIPEESLSRVFDRFYRVDEARTGAGRTGLGLAIVASIVRAHGGRVSVESPPGEGAIFRVELPVPPAPSRSDECHLGDVG